MKHGTTDSRNKGDNNEESQCRYKAVECNTRVGNVHGNMGTNAHWRAKPSLDLLTTPRDQGTQRDGKENEGKT